MFAQCQRFNDVNTHAGAIVGWQQTYDQMSAGSAHTELVHLTAERFQIFREYLDKRVVQHGVAPPGRLCLAMPVGGDRAGVFQGSSVGGTDVTLLHSGQEFFVHAAEGMDLLAISVDALRLEQLTEREFTASALRKLNRSTRLDVSPQFLFAIRQQLQSIVSTAVDGGQLLESQLENLVLECTLVLLEQVCEPCSGRSGNVAVSAYLVRKAHQIAMETVVDPADLRPPRCQSQHTSAQLPECHGFAAGRVSASGSAQCRTATAAADPRGSIHHRQGRLRPRLLSSRAFLRCLSEPLR
jgi:hypothetical protein